MPGELAPPAPALASALLGDAASWALVLDPLHPRLVALAARRIPASLRGRLEPDDLVQETYLRILERSHTFEERGPTSFLGWAVRLLENTVTDAVRHQGRQRRSPAREAQRSDALEFEDERASASSPLLQLLRAEEQGQLDRELERLDREERRLLSDRFQGGASFACIARARGWSESTARRRLEEVLERLQVALAG